MVAGTGQLGGMQIDKTIDRIYVNDENNGAGMWFDIANIALTNDTYTNYRLNITSTNPGNGGIYLPTSTQILGLNDNQLATVSFSLYPNPSNGAFNIDTTENIKNIAAFDILGKEIMVKTLSNNQFSIENKGVYFLKIELENGQIVNRKIVIN